MQSHELTTANTNSRRGQKIIPINLIFMDPCIVDDPVEIQTRCSFVTEFIIPKFIERPTCFEGHTAHHQEL
jgi:hypothetical protein